jgi:hypothetical protein
MFKNGEKSKAPMEGNAKLVWIDPLDSDIAKIHVYHN